MPAAAHLEVAAQGRDRCGTLRQLVECRPQGLGSLLGLGVRRFQPGEHGLQLSGPRLLARAHGGYLAALRRQGRRLGTCLVEVSLRPPESFGGHLAARRIGLPGARRVGTRRRVLDSAACPSLLLDARRQLGFAGRSGERRAGLFEGRARGPGPRRPRAPDPVGAAVPGAGHHDKLRRRDSKVDGGLPATFHHDGAKQQPVKQLADAFELRAHVLAEQGPACWPDREHGRR